MTLITLAGLIPGADPQPIPGMGGTVSQLLGYGLWLLALAAVLLSGSLITIINGIAGG